MYINKIDELLKECGGAKTVFLPYLSDEDKYLYLIDNFIEGDQNFDGPVESFINDPVSFLKKSNVEKICFIHHNKSDNENEIDDSEKPDFPAEVNFFFDSNFNFDLQFNLTPKSDMPDSDPIVYHYFDTGSVKINQIWLFKFFNKELDKSKLMTLKGLFKNLLQTNSDPTINEISDALQLNKITFDEIKNIYIKLFTSSQMNDTSLLLYNQPINIQKIDIAICNCHRDYKNYYHLRYLCCKNNFRYRSRNKNNSFLLTGDIKLNDACIDQIKTKWGIRILKSVFIIQVPHHGANDYLTKNALSEFELAFFGVINYGLGNIYKHPHKNIISLLTNHHRKIYIQSATQASGVRFIYFLGNNT
jgi:hypothetical protein